VKQVTIIGLGLIGGSLAKAIRCKNSSVRIIGWAKQMEEKASCEQHGICNRVVNHLEEAVNGSDVVVVCTPPDVISGLIQEFIGELKPGAIIMDVGSTKEQICHEVLKISGANGCFVGAHPMAGSEKSGIVHAQEDLFKGKVCFLTPTNDTTMQTKEKAKLFWERLNMRVIEVTPEEHDEIVACVSHLPHILANILCVHLKQENLSWGEYVGQGFKDMTRIADGNPDLWRAIIEQNRNPIVQQLKAFKEVLTEVIESIQMKNGRSLHAFLEQGKVVREDLR